MLRSGFDHADAESGGLSHVGAVQREDDRQRHRSLRGKSRRVIFPTLRLLRNKSIHRRRFGSDAEIMAVESERPPKISGAASAMWRRLSMPRRKAPPSWPSPLSDNRLRSSPDCSADFELQYFALGDDARGRGQNVEHAQASRFDHQLESAAKQEIADQDCWALLPHTILAAILPRRSAPGVHHIVMQQRRGVNEFDGGRQIDLVVARIVADARRRRG